MSHSDATSISPGDVIDDYEIIEVLATGGSSTTFRARHRTLARDVSLKYVHPVVFAAEGTGIDAARADAKRVARLEHPGIAAVFAAGDHRGGLYVAGAMPKGRTLTDLAAAAAITPAEVARVIHGAAAALEYAHELDIVHRDLRPDCIRVDGAGHGVIHDFGITRPSGRTGLLTRAEALDSMRYTAPEIVRGAPATPATDVYGLAAVAVYCLIGAPPYRDRPAAEHVQFRVDAAAPTLVDSDGTPIGELNALLSAAMAVEPAVRPAPARFAAQLSEAVARMDPALQRAGSPLSAREPAAAARPAAHPGVRDATRVELSRPLPAPPAEAERPPPWATYAGCTMVALSIGLAGLLVGRSSAPQGAAPVRAGAFTFEPGRTWTRDDARPSSIAGGVRLAGAPGESATVAATRDARLPGDPLPARLLPDGAGTPRAARAAGTPVVVYRAPGTTVVARSTSRGTAFAVCVAPAGATRCAALVVAARGPGRELAPAPAKAVAGLLRSTMTQIEQATTPASVELAGEASLRAAAAGRLAIALRGASAGLAVEGADRGTAAALGRVRSALDDQAAALDDLSSAMDQRSDVRIDGANDRVRAGYRRFTLALGALRRAGYPIQRPQP